MWWLEFVIQTNLKHDIIAEQFFFGFPHNELMDSANATQCHLCDKK